MPKSITRRTFSTASAAALTMSGVHATSSRAARAPLANEQIQLGFIGVANRGGQLIDAFGTHRDAQIVALCDVDQRALDSAKQKLGSRVDTTGDFRRLIDRKELDAVVIATPDHWHALQTVTACDAGKDVYVEKPLSITVHEGRRMVAAARRNERVVQVGTHRRSSPVYQELVRRTRAGEFGKICLSRAYRISNMYPDGIGRAEPTAPPPHLDWDMWLGPRPARPFQTTIAPYKFRWWQQYSSQMGNWGVHYLDAIRWCTGEEAPAGVCAMGGRFAVVDDRTIPDTLEVCFEFSSGRLAIFGQYETSGNPALARGEIEMRGTQGTLYVDGNGYQVVPERGGQFQDRKARMQPETIEGTGSNASLTELHTRNFLDCMRTRAKPNADVEIGHRSTTFSLIANISLAVGQRLQWDPQGERFVANDQANQLLHYEYRKPWSLA